MSTKVTQVLSTRNQMHVDVEVSRIFVFGNHTSPGQITNGGGSTLELKEGTVLGRVASSGLLAVMKSSAVDGSQLPVGVLMSDIDIAAAATVDVNAVVSGDVIEERLIFDGTDDLDTVITPTVTIPILVDDNVVSGGDSTVATDVGVDQPKTYRDLIQSNTVGIHLISQGDDLTGLDNQ